MRYSFESRDRISAASNGFLSFAKNMDKNAAKHISKNLSDK